MRRIVSLLFGLLLCALAVPPAAAQSTLVRMQTVLGPIDVALYDAAAPLTVANFLQYVNSGAYTSSFIHRSVPGFVIQGGGYHWDEVARATPIPTNAPVNNEYGVTRPNVRGTIAMAKVGGNPDSATSQWFFNLVDNTATLGPSNNGGFTVFGRVTAPGMAVVDAIAALQIANAGGVFSSLPLRSYPADNILRGANLVLVNSIAVLPAAATDSDRIFNYLEAAYPQYLSPPSGTSATGYGYYYRYYAGSNAYLGSANGQLYYLVPAINNNINTLGSVADWLAIAVQAGY